MSSKLCSFEKDNWNDDKNDIDSTVMKNELENWLDSVEEELTDPIMSDFNSFWLDNEEEFIDKKEQKNNNFINIKELNNNSCELSLPTTRVFSNDIRHNFARMFMNTFNSGDFIHVQNFLNTYMTRSSKVIAEHYLRSDALKFPPLVVTDGPRQFSHYLIGHFIQYPDLIMSMTDCRVITHPNWLGTKVEIDITTSSTKMCSLSMDDWIPAVNKLTEKYNEAIQENQILLKPTTGTLNTTTTCTVNDNTGTSTNTLHLLRKEQDPEVPYLSDLTIDSGDEILQSKLQQQKQQRRPQKRSMKTKQYKNTITTGTTTESVAVGIPAVVEGVDRKKYYPRKVRARVDRSLTSPGVYAPIKLTDILASTECMGSYIPEEYSRLLFNKAIPLSKPLLLTSQGRMTLYLNENNQLKQMYVQVGQTNI